MEELKFGDLLVSNAIVGPSWRTSVVMMYLCPRNQKTMTQFWGLILKDDESLRRQVAFTDDYPFPLWAGLFAYWVKKENQDEGS